MPSAKKKKGVLKPKHIVARSIDLVDAKGNLRIHMDAGNGDGYALIWMLGEDGRSIQISTQPNGSMGVTVYGPRCTAFGTLGMSPDGRSGLHISDSQGRLGALLGSPPGKDDFRLMLFSDGQHQWSSAKSTKPKRKKVPRKAK
jgi:hypothetical protein